ncbi:MAG TPA: rhomboid family intramembrane serine protease [Gemmataceae bacterium]|nr:rhomboid family intramembrane serine protease [Gemmataceae bacterium]
MFLPLGDNVSKRTFPAVGAILIALNFLFYIYTTRLWFESVKPATVSISEDGEYEVQLSAPAYEKFMHRWGLVPADLARGNVFSIFTSMFMHADIFHILGNMVMLYALMSSLESLLGWQRFLLCYLGWGVAAALADVAANWGSTIPTIGASGAIAGVIGAYFIMFGPFAKIRTLVWFGAPMKFDVPATLFVVIWVIDQLLGLSVAVESGVTGVAWFAHVGGFVAGAATMYVLKPKLSSRMVLDRNGQLIIQEEQEETPAESETSEALAAQSQAPPTQCPYCNTDLANAVQIHDRLLRCSNSACGRLIFLTSALPISQPTGPEPQPALAGTEE